MRGIAAPFELSYVPGQWLESIQVSKGLSTVVNGVESITGQKNTVFAIWMGYTFMTPKPPLSEVSTAYGTTYITPGSYIARGNDVNC